MKKVLFILGNFYPETSANGICCMEIMQKLRQQGCQVHCIANQSHALKAEDMIDGISIHRCKILLSNYLQTKYKNANNTALKFLWKLLLKTKSLAVHFLSAINFPFVSYAFIRRMEKCAGKIIKREKIDTVICVSQPTTALYAGCNLKKKYRISVVSYLLDPIINGSFHKWVSSKRRKRIQTKLQDRVLESSDLVIAQNEHEKLFDYVKDPCKKEKLFYLGAPLLVKKDVPAICLDKTTKTVIYAGGLSATRSPAYIVEVFRYVKSAKLHLYTGNQSKWLTDMVKDNPNVVLHSRIDRQELLSLMKGADGLLSIGNLQGEYAPSKLIECISFGKPLITTYRTDGDTCKHYMDNYPRGLYIDERDIPPEVAAKQIDAMLSMPQEELVFSELERIYWDNTPDAFLQIINRKQVGYEPH